MSTQAMAAPEEESCMVLILGKPGGGKGTISGKIIKVRLTIEKQMILGIVRPIGGWACRKFEILIFFFFRCFCYGSENSLICFLLSLFLFLAL